MEKVKWLVDSCLMTKDENTRMLQALSDNDVHVSAYRPFVDEVNTHGLTSYDPVAVYGTIQFARRTSQFCGNLFIQDDYLVTNYRETIGPIPDSDWLNNGMFTTWGMLKRTISSYVSPIFVRPNSGSKIFTGLAIHPVKFLEKANGEMLPWAEIEPTTLVQVSVAQKIHSEYRMFIYEGKVITGSMYGDGKRSSFVDPKALEFAQSFAELSTWEIPFVLDVAILKNGSVKAVEINCITCAGWYDADYSKIVKCINEYTLKAHRELNGD